MELKKRTYLSDELPWYCESKISAKKSVFQEKKRPQRIAFAQKRLCAMKKNPNVCEAKERNSREGIVFVKSAQHESRETPTHTQIISSHAKMLC